MSTQPHLAQALVVGISRYRNVAPLRSTRDASGMREVLADSDYCGYPPERIQVLEEERATRENVLHALGMLCEQARGPSARTFLYFSGHGGQDTSGTAYILPVDARKGQYASTAISARELAKHLDRCSGEVTVALDCCYAAGMAGRSDEPHTELGSFADGFRDDIQSHGRVILAASRPGTLAYGAIDAPYGIFTGHLLDGLRGKASTDGYDVTVHQLFDYVQKHVESSSNGMQRPSLIASIDKFYPLTRYPRRITPSIVFEADVYLSYDRKDPIVSNWVKNVLRPELVGNGRSIWDHDPLGQVEITAAEEAIKKSKYVVVLLTRSYLANRLDEFKATLSILQAVHTRTPRFIPVLRERCDVPLSIEAFVGLDMTDDNQMEFRYSMERLNARLQKDPHVR